MLHDLHIIFEPMPFYNAQPIQIQVKITNYTFQILGSFQFFITMPWLFTTISNSS